MGRKEKILWTVKINVIEEYLKGLISINEIASTLNVHPSSVKTWITKYKAFGPEGIINKSKNINYSGKIKLAAVTDYLKGGCSLNEVCIKYRILSYGSLQQWIKKYNGHSELKSCYSKGVNVMTNGRKTTYEERVEVVSFCIANDKDYNLTADKFEISYQQVYG